MKAGGANERRREEEGGREGNPREEWNMLNNVETVTIEESKSH